MEKSFLHQQFSLLRNANASKGKHNSAKHFSTASLMRKNLLLLFIILASQIFSACFKPDDGLYTDPITIYEKMGGTWDLTRLNMVDEIAVAGSLKPDVLNLTSQLDFRSFKINFEVNEAFEPTAFEVSGNAPGLFLQSGYWELSNPFPNTDGTPVQIKLYSDAEKTMLVDILDMAAIPGARAVMEFKLTRKDEGIPYITYHFALRQ
jgi:hypothetical protein